MYENIIILTLFSRKMSKYSFCQELLSFDYHIIDVKFTKKNSDNIESFHSTLEMAHDDELVIT